MTVTFPISHSWWLLNFLFFFQSCSCPAQSCFPWLWFTLSSRHGLYHDSWVAQTVKKLPATWETWVWSLGWVDPLEKGMASHSRTLAWRIPWTEEPGGLQSMGSQRVRHHWATNAHTRQSSSLLSEPWASSANFVSFFFFGKFYLTLLNPYSQTHAILVSRIV